MFVITRWTSVNEYIVDRLVPTDSAVDCVLSANAAATLIRTQSLSSPGETEAHVPHGM